LYFCKLRRRRATDALHKKRRYNDARQKIAFVPVCAWAQANACGTLGSRTVTRLLPNNVSPALFRKTNWHNAKHDMGELKS
jgi:hypothetical protein